MLQQITVTSIFTPDDWLNDTCREFDSMTRTAYNRLIEGASARKIIEILGERYGENAYRWRENALTKAEAVASGQEELLALRIDELEWKLQQVKRRMGRTANPLKKKGYAARVRKLERKRRTLEAHLKNGTLPKVVFGGRGRVDSEERRRKRRGHLYSVGSAWNRGNLKTRIIKQGDAILLEVRNWHSQSRIYPLSVPKRYRLSFNLLAEGKLEPLTPMKSPYAVRPYTVNVIRMERGARCQVSFAVPTIPLHAWRGERVASVDSNPTHIDVAIVNKHGNLVASKTFSQPAMLYARRSKRQWLASNLLNKALNWIEFHRADAIVFEELRFKGREYGKRGNRTLANFNNRQLHNLATTKTLKRELILITVPAAYSSKVAATKYKQQFPRISVHQLAAFVLARRALGFTEKLSLDQLKEIAGRTRKRQTLVKAKYLHGHRHPYLRSPMSADGRIDMENGKGMMKPKTEWVTPRIRDTAKNDRRRMQRLSYLLPCKRQQLGRMEANRDDGWTRRQPEVAFRNESCVTPENQSIDANESKG